MNKEQQIKEIEKVLQNEQLRISNTADGFKQLMKEGVCKCHAEALYNAGYRKVPDDVRELIDTLYNAARTRDEIDNLIEENKQLKAENAIIKTNLKKLEEKNEELLNEKYDAQDDLDCYYDEMPNKIKQAKIEAVKEFAEKIKNEVYPFLQAEMYNQKHFIAGDSEIDKLFENQNVGILKAQDVLSKWFKVKIDELLKEYEK